MVENKDTLQVQEQQSWIDILEKERSFAPLVDIYETEEDYILIANMPGVSKENVQVKFEEDSLHIFGKINYEESLNRKYILNENGIGHYYRRFKLSDSIDESGIEANLNNGQLVVKLPKHERIKPRTINIR